MQPRKIVIAFWKDSENTPASEITVVVWKERESMPYTFPPQNRVPIHEKTRQTTTWHRLISIVHSERNQSHTNHLLTSIHHLENFFLFVQIWLCNSFEIKGSYFCFNQSLSNQRNASRIGKSQNVQVCWRSKAFRKFDKQCSDRLCKLLL